MVFIYILELENNKYYVGKTTNPDFRLEQHFNNSGYQWTKKYKPIKILELKSNCDDYDEDKYTKMYMDKFGINNVRGGSYVQIKLDKVTIENLEKMNRGTTDKCFLCGEKDILRKIVTKSVTMKMFGFVNIVIKNLQMKINVNYMKINVN
jgi:hypothetical protein